jgi:hypothetical protein
MDVNANPTESAPTARRASAPERSTMSVVTPSALAEELGITSKALRTFLRSTFPRDAAAKNTSWALDADAIAAARAKFAPEATVAPVPLAAQAMCWALAKGAALPTPEEVMPA